MHISVCILHGRGGTILYINKERGLTETKSCPSYFSKTKEKWLVKWIFAKPSSWLVPLALECQSCFSLGQVSSVLFFLNFELFFLSIVVQYPKEPPHINILESKGLDEQRKFFLITGIQDKACELLSCLMLVALCEVIIAPHLYSC